MLLTACGERSKHAFYDMLHEHKRQACLKQGRTDCHREESYEKYKSRRDSEIER